ncbi:transposase [Cohnella cholangitidis]|uniref:Transposase n=1 Tax=Cohnella cholangitidis TaxID=2598458 RepID=A0A7G5C6H6_9BACL|nr:transposase [Cohnella cholangitidis]
MKAILRKEGMVVSRRRIGRLMKNNGLVSVYTVAPVAQYKPNVSTFNDSFLRQRCRQLSNAHR